MFFIPTLRVVFLDVFRLRLVGVNNMPSPRSATSHDVLHSLSPDKIPLDFGP